MRVAILSDIHGNLQALDAVLEEVRAAAVDETWCLGDVVGYGADPERCCERVRAAADVCLAGNHDLAATGELSLEDFSRGAAIAARWTREHLPDEHLAWLRSLDPVGARAGVGIFHGSPRDPVWEYVLTEKAADLCFDAFPEWVGLIGHSHVALAFRREDGDDARGTACSGGDETSLHGARWLINPGSVGQPRDGDPRAAWLLLDTDAATAHWRRTEYDIAAAQAAIRAAGLPSGLADRLEAGQ